MWKPLKAIVYTKYLHYYVHVVILPKYHILLCFLLHQTSLNQILIQMHHSRILFPLFSRELHGPHRPTLLGDSSSMVRVAANSPGCMANLTLNSRIRLENHHLYFGWKEHGVTKQVSVKWTFKKQPEQHVCETPQKQHLGGNVILHVWGSQNPFGV